METKLFLLRDKEPLRLGVEDVLTGVITKLNIDMCCPSVILDILRDYFDIDEFDAYSMCGQDYFMKFTYKSKTYALYGNGYYGNLIFEKYF